MRAVSSLPAWLLLAALVTLLHPPVCPAAETPHPQSQQPTSQPHSLKLGFNVGYITDAQYYAKAFARIGRDGLGHTRFMGPFMHPQGEAQERAEAWTASWLRNISVAVGPSSSITVTLSDYPFNVQNDFLAHPGKYLSVWPGQPSAAALQDTLRYTNRAPPTRGAWANNASLADYLAVLRRLRATLGPLDAAIDWEIGNEPNALGYFWGTAADFEPIATGSLTALSGSAPPTRVACCAFATELSCQGLARGADNGFFEFAQGVTARHTASAAGAFPTPLSWHFYRRTMNDANTARSTFANASRFFGAAALRGSIITEWGTLRFPLRCRPKRQFQHIVFCQGCRPTTRPADRPASTARCYCWSSSAQWHSPRRQGWRSWTRIA